MESANLHHQHHQLQDQLVGSSPSSANPSCFGVWTPNNTLNPNNFSPNTGGVITNSRDSRQQQNDYLVPPGLNNSMVQDLSLHWANSNLWSADDLHLARIKGELSDSYQKFTEMINSSSSSSSLQEFQLQPTSFMKNEEREFYDMSEKHLSSSSTSSSSGSQINGHRLQLPASSSFSFSQIFPSINVSDMNQSSPSISDMNKLSLDLFTSGRFYTNLSQVSVDNLGLNYKDSLSHGLDHSQPSSHRPSCTSSKISSFNSGVSESKRPGSSLETKVPQAAQKKSRSDSRTSCPPFKVRKEKLGDRIAALQQLVAPFGKTDTASVLMEAIGYIKFLQNQVETLSVPYMKSSRNKASRILRGGSLEDGNEEPKRDLRSRGLCLVPLSCLSYVTDGGGGIWPTP